MSAHAADAKQTDAFLAFLGALTHGANLLLLFSQVFVRYMKLGFKICTASCISRQCRMFLLKCIGVVECVYVKDCLLTDNDTLFCCIPAVH